MATPPSPFDPYLYAFLGYLRHHSATFSPTSPKCLSRAADALGVHPALIEALFTSAGSRGLVRPRRAPAGRSRWELSRKGEEFVSAFTDNQSV